MVRVFYPTVAALLLVAAIHPAGAHPYDNWAAEYFSSPLEPLARIQADPDGDGHENFVEWALGSNPLAAPSRPPVSSGFTEVGGQLRTYLRYARRTGDDAGNFLVIAAQASTDLNSWEGAGGPLGLTDILDANQSPALPGFEWRLASVPADGPTIYLRSKIISLTDTWQQILAQQEVIERAIDQYAIETNQVSTAPVCWNCVRQFLPENHPYRDEPALDVLGNPFTLSTVAAGAVIHPVSIDYVKRGRERAEHIYTWDTLARLLDSQLTTLRAAKDQYAIENNKVSTSPVNGAIIQPYVHSYGTEGPEYQGGHWLDALGNQLQVGPTIGDPIRLSATTYDRLDAAGWIVNENPKRVWTNEELVVQMHQDSRILEGALDQWAIENNKVLSDPVPTLAVLMEYVSPAFRLGREGGQDVFGNNFILGPLVRDGIRFHPDSIAALQALGLGEPVVADQLAYQVHRGMRELIQAVYAKDGNVPFTPAKFAQPLSWEILKPFVNPASEIYLADGLDPLGRPYQVGPTYIDYLRLAPETAQYLTDHHVLESYYPYPSTKRERLVGMINDFRLLQNATEQYLIEGNLPYNSPITWPVVAQCLAWPRNLLLRGGLDPFGHPYSFPDTNMGYPRIAAASMDQVNSDWGGVAVGNLCNAARLVPGDLAGAAQLLELYRLAHALPLSAAVSWGDVLPWLETLPITDIDNFHRAYGFDSLGNRPVVGPTFADPVLINPATEAAITAAGIPIPEA